MPSRDDIVATARTYLGTPYHHQGRVKGVGIDCIGLLVCVARELGIQVHDIEGYSRFPDGHTILEELPKCLDAVETPVPGDILVFWFDRPELPGHAGIQTDVGVIHTYTVSKKVVEHTLNKVWMRRICASFAYRI